MVYHPIKLLLVEDNPGDVLLLQETLSEITHFELELVHAARLADGLQFLQSDTFDVVLLDLLLPDSEGLETFIQIYQQVPLTPIIVLTGIADETLAIRALQAGAQDYLVKGQVSGSELLIRAIRYAIERKRIEVALYRQEQEYRTLSANAPDIIARFDRDLRHLYVNPAIEAVTGLSVQDILGKNNRELGFPEVLVEQWEEVLRQVFQTGEPILFQFTFLTPMGDRHFQSRCVPEFGLNGNVESILGITRDITEQKQLEAQFLRAQRLESLGTLASGIAHDLNNILTPILAIAQLLPLKLSSLNEENQELLTMLEENTRRGAELVKQILAFARGLEGERVPLQVKHPLREVERVIRSTFPKSITLRSTFNREIGLVAADATQLQQVFMNLCVNARDAMPNGGILGISAENSIIDPAYARMHPNANPGTYVVITVTDTGTGIAPEQLDRIFDPFFTTKAVGEGTGLGLSSAMGIVNNHGGFMTVQSEVGKGTQFQVFLPVIAGVETEEKAPEQEPMGGGELILVVDDEANIRETLKITLELQNYRIITAKDGIEAIALYTEHQDDIKVVLIDMMMPSMGGDLAIQALRAINPNVKLIVCSGLATRETLPSNIQVNAFIAKPFTTGDLSKTLQTVLLN
jgi:two-component system, cell cycle sensor histidine kinase and response regulator CckA